MITAIGALATGGWLIYIRLAGTPLDEEVIDTDRASLLMALDNLLFALGLALLLIGMFTLFTPAGASLALAGGGVAAGAATVNLGATVPLILGGVTIAIAESTGDSGGTSSASSSSGGGRGAQQSGSQYEQHLHNTLGGQGNFTRGGREFDGVYRRPDGSEVWYEAKSGGYWSLLNSNERLMNRFKGTAGQQMGLARQNNASFEIISENPIPKNITDWLDLKGIPWRVIPKG